MSDASSQESIRDVTRLYATVFKSRKEGKLDVNPYMLLSDDDWQRERWVHLSMIEAAFIVGVHGAIPWPGPRNGPLVGEQGVDFIKGLAVVEEGVRKDLVPKAHDWVVQISLRRVLSLFHKWTKACPVQVGCDMELALYNAILELDIQTGLLEEYAKESVAEMDAEAGGEEEG
jgi:hypothetical protein